MRALESDPPEQASMRFTEEQGENVVTWCGAGWRKGRAYPLAFWQQSSRAEFEYGELTEEQRTTFTERARRVPYSDDVLAEEAGVHR